MRLKISLLLIAAATLAAGAAPITNNPNAAPTNPFRASRDSHRVVDTIAYDLTPLIGWLELERKVVQGQLPKTALPKGPLPEWRTFGGTPVEKYPDGLLVKGNMDNSSAARREFFFIHSEGGTGGLAILTGTSKTVRIRECQHCCEDGRFRTRPGIQGEMTMERANRNRATPPGQYSILPQSRGLIIC